jgi:glyoxylase-like metal-dependent hydrolase (beta-lactamase superfamily II)
MLRPQAFPPSSPHVGTMTDPATWSLGDITVTRIEQSMAPVAELPALFPQIDPDAIRRHLSWLTPHFVEPGTQRYIISLHAWLVRTPHHTIVVDTCSGNGKTRPGSAQHHMLDTPVLERLAAAGCRPEDVDYVFCTHLHVDHVGFNTTLVGGRWVPTFPRARYLFSRADYVAWDPSDPACLHRGDNDLIFADSIAPVAEAGQAVFVDDGWELDRTFRVQAAHGHTPGHFVIRAQSRGERALFAGDAMHHPIQIPEPHVNSKHCIDPAAAERARRMVLETCASEGDLLLPAHFGAPHLGRVTADGSTFAFRPGA